MNQMLLGNASLDVWLHNNQQRFYEQAVSDIDQEPALYNAVRLVQRGQSYRDGDVSRTQLTALLNMARTQHARSIRFFIDQRKTRRENIGKPREAAFWGALLRKLKWITSQAEEAVTDCQIKNVDNEVLHIVESRIMGAYLEHFVAHCRYRTRFTIDEVNE